MMAILPTLLPTLILVATFGHVLIGLIVAIRGATLRGKSTFVFASFVFAIWSFSNFLIYATDYTVSVRLAYGLGALIYPSLVVWLLYFLSEATVPRWQPLAIYLLTAPFVILPFFEGPMIGNIVPDPVIGLSQSFGPWFTAYTIFFFTTYIVILIALSFAYRQTKKLEKRLQLRILFFGFLFAEGLFLFFNFVLPEFGIDFLIDFDVPATIVLIGSIAYAMYRHALYDTKMVAAQVISIAIGVLVFVEIIVPAPLSGEVSRSIVLFGIVFLGIALIRSINKEVRQRVEMEEVHTQLKSVVATMAHDLKSPLTVAKTNVDLALRNPETHDSFDTTLAAINQEIQHMSQMISHFNATSKNTSFAPIKLDELVKDICTSLAPLVASRKASLEQTTKPVEIIGDESALRRALTNIIVNAIQHGGEGVVIDVSITSDAQQAYVAIVDTGPGIPAAIKQTLFEEGIKGPQSQGQGLGLASVKKTVEAHGGSVTISNNRKSKTGVCVQVTLPKHFST